MKKVLLVLALMLSLAVCMTGCKKEPPTDEPPADTEPA